MTRRVFRSVVFLAALGLATVAAAQTVSVTLTTPATNYLAAGGTVTLTATINYSAMPSALGGTIFLPAGWSLASTGGANVPNVSPAPGSTVQLDYLYFSFPATPAQFTVTLNYPPGLTGSQTITSSFQYRSPIQNFTPAAIVLTAVGASTPVITTQPQAASVTPGGATVLSVMATGTPAPTYQWRKNGTAMTGATGTSLSLSNFQVADAGAYSVVVTNSAGSVTSQSAAVGLATLAKVTGSAYEFQGDILHANSNTYDQVLLTGAAATITADAGQVTRMSYLDLNDDIVQVEFSGRGTLTLSLENATGPAVAAKYNQPDVTYMKGHASLVITGADQGTFVTVFTVGTATAFNQALFPAGVTYDAMADLGLISIATTDGKFGGIRASNVSFFRAAGLTGISAPGVAVLGPTYIGDITADADATGVLVFGSTTDARITGGDLRQLNNRAIQVDGITTLTFTAGTKSNHQLQPVQVNQGRLERNGVDVTSQVVR